MRKVIFLMMITVLIFIGCKDKADNPGTDNGKTSAVINSTKSAGKVYPNVHIKAKPDSISIDTAKTVVIVVDMENDFASKGGLMDKIGTDMSIVQRVIKPTANVLAIAREAGIPIIYLKMAYHSDLSDIGSKESPNNYKQHPMARIGDTVNAPNGAKGRILIRDTWNTDIVPDLKPQAGDIVVYKTRFSGFYKTELDSILNSSGKKYLIVTGCTTSVCVESTVRDAMFRDYVPIVLEDCVAEPIGHDLPRSNHEATLSVVERLLGWVSTSSDFISALKRQPIIGKQKLQ